MSSACRLALAALAGGWWLLPVLACGPTPTTAVPPDPAAAAPRADTETEPLAPAREVPLEPPAQAQTTPSGVAIHVLTAGDPSGPQPRAGDQLELRYRVWNDAGEVVDSSRPGHTEILSTTWLPPGWAEAMYALHVGDRAHIWVPATRAYLDHPDAPQGALAIEVELVSLTSTTVQTDEVPLTAPPDNALRTASGLAFVVLQAGAGTRHPAPDAKVTVHYEGWTTDGERFDSSYERGQPATFPLTAVIPGWQEALPLMVEGEKTRFWIPEALAYGQRPGRPNGMLIFDVELVRIEP